MREASSHQSNVGMLPRFPSRSLSLVRAQSRIWEMRESARSPQTAIVLASLSFSALFSASQTGERPRYNASPTPSQLSCHWLHMRNNETSSETRLQKKGGGSIRKIVLKERGNCGIKKAEAFVFFSLWPLSFGRFGDLLS